MTLINYLTAETGAQSASAKLLVLLWAWGQAEFAVGSWGCSLCAVRQEGHHSTHSPLVLVLPLAVPMF